MYQPQTRIKITFERDGETRDTYVTLDNLAEREAGGSKTMIDGLTLENLDEKDRYRLRIPNDVNGVLITEVDPKSEAASQNLAAGDVIVQVEKTPVDSLASLGKTLRERSGAYKRVYVYRNGHIFIVALK